MLKQFKRSKIGLFCLGWLGAGIIALLMLSVRWRTEDREGFEHLLASHDGIVVVFWHERILAMPWLWPRRHTITALQSPHPDGRLMANTISHLGARTVWGSSNRNALSGLRGMKRLLDNKGIAAVTPDGPRGPARIAALGPVALAQMAGKPIIPVAWSADRHWRARGWDRLMIPKPLSRGVFVIGDPIAPPVTRDRDVLEAHRLALQDAMNEITARADRLSGADR